MQKNKSIQNKFMSVMLITSSVVLFLTCAAYFGYEYYSFRKTTVDQLTVISKMIAANSTAALAFDNQSDAEEVLTALQAEPHIVSAVLFDAKGNVFARYPTSDSLHSIPAPELGGVVSRFEDAGVVVWQPVTHQTAALGTLYLMSDMGAMYDRFKLYTGIAGLVVAVSFFVAYLLSRSLQRNLSRPILDLANTARAVSENTDYSVRARRYDDDEIGLLTDAFNKMLVRIEQQNQEITALNQDLENKVVARTKDLETAYREMEAFSYTVSHDLNAPLRHIDSYIGMFLSKHENSLDENGKKTLDIITNKTRRLRQLIDDLLAFSQLGRKELVREPVKMEDLVREITAEYKKIDQHAHVVFQIGRLPDAYGDAVTLRQVWENLISNAVKYSGQRKEPRIQILARSQNGATEYSIQDNGAGFDMKNYAKLFNPFQRLHNQSEFEGTGVGLAIVERIISKHGGKVWAESRLDEGTTFYFSIPTGA